MTERPGDARDFLRRVILTGRTVLLPSPGPVLLRGMEALGAEAGLDVVHVEFGDFAKPGPNFRWERRPHLPDSGHWHGLGHPARPGGPCTGSPPHGPASARVCLPRASGRPLSGRDAAGLRGPGTGHWVDPRPVHDLAPALAGRGMVVVHTDGPHGLRYLAWLAVACADAAGRDGRPAPAILGFDVDEARSLGDRLGWPCAGPHPHGFWACCPEPDPVAAVPGEAVPGLWAARVAARRSVASASRSGGLWTVRGEGRAVHVVRSGCGRDFRPREPDRESVLVAAVEGGSVTGHRVTVSRRLDDGAMAGIAMEAWSSGRPYRGRERVGGLATGCRDYPDILDDCRRNGLKWDGDEGALASAVADDLGPDRAGALGKLGPDVPVAALSLWASDGPAPGRRLQFLSSFPVLATLGLDPEVTRLVDAGRPPLPRLCAILGAPPAAVRRLLSQDDLFHALHQPADWRRLGAILASVDHNRLPPHGGKAHWWGLFQAVSRLMALGGRVPRHVPAAARLACTIPGATWPRRLSRLQALEQPGLSGIRDMLRALSWWLDALAAHPLGKERLDVAARYGTFLRLCEASRLWHADPVLVAASGGVPADARWPVPFGTVDLGDGWVAACLASMPDLASEGLRGPDADGMPGLAHCVASYGWRCMRGDSLVVSLRARTPEGLRRVSTLELHPAPEGTWSIGGRRFGIAQHRGFRNGDPGAEALARAERLRLALAGGHPVDAAALAPRQAATDRGGREAALALLPRWRPILPRAWARLDVPDILADLGAVPGAAAEDAA